MKIQFGTVDGLVNITEDKIRIFVNAIKEFSQGGLEFAKKQNISLGSAFQRFVEPVYSGKNTKFDFKSIDTPVFTRNGEEQSPARVTFCKKMGLLQIDEVHDIFRLTPIGEELWYKKITIEEYALILLSKQGLFEENVFSTHVMTFVYEWFTNHNIITEADVKNTYPDDQFVKTRIDIILNAFSTCGLLYNYGSGKFGLSNIKSVNLLKDFYENRNYISPAQLDNTDVYTNYIGNLENGIFDILDKVDKNTLSALYPNLEKYKSYPTKYKSYPTNKHTPFDVNAIRTKPFVLLAGISGTGKSRIVKQMAFDSCPNIDDLQKDKTSPGNYQLIEVKPNWHDSTEVLGYESEIGGKHYVTTPFVRFLVKAMFYEDKVPFFVCMDEMNLAPVEQYFAEFLSVLESRKLINNRITSEALIKAEIFKNYEDKLKAELRDQKKDNKEGNGTSVLTEVEVEYRNKFDILYERLKKEGLRIPSNLIVVGTVNMDETTHQFSRKVIDRAMTIEMNIADGTEPFADFFENDAELDYRTEPLDKDLFLPKVVQAKEALGEIAKLNASDVDYLKAKIPALLSNLNEALNGTPFKIAYRVQNELVIYFFELRREEKNKDATAETLLIQAMDAILMQKVLPRVEGDEDLLEKPLEKLHAFTQNYKNSHEKVEEMQARLNAHFTSFWP